MVFSVTVTVAVAILGGGWFSSDFDQGVEARFDVTSGLLEDREVESGRKWDDEVNLGAIANHGETLALSGGLVLLQIERSDAIDIVVGDLQDVIGLAQFGRKNPIHHALVVMKVFQGIGRNAQLIKDVLLHVEHGMVEGINGVELFVRELSGIGDAVDVDVEESHEDADDETAGIEIVISQGVPKRIRAPFDFDDRFVWSNFTLVKDHAVGRRKKVTQVRVARANRVTEEMKLR